MNAAAVSISELKKVYAGDPPTTALHGIDLEIEHGELFGLVGPNGAGKSTTIGVCTTRIRPSAGRVAIAGADVAREPVQVRRSIGVVNQTNTLDRSCTVWENLYLHCLLFGSRPRAARARTEELLEAFRLGDRRGAFPAVLSGGMARRLELARALAHQPRVLFLDEPTASLDPQSRLAVWELVKGLKRLGVTVVLSTQAMEEADVLCDRVAIIDHGRVLVCEQPGRLKRSLGAETIIQLHVAGTDGLGERLLAIPGVVAVENTRDNIRVLGNGDRGVVPRVVETAMGSGLQGLAISEPTLEAVFIKLTGRDPRD